MNAATPATALAPESILTMSEPLTTLPTPAVKTLADSFAVFTYTPHRYGGQKTDQEASSEVASAKGAEKKAVKVVKELFAGNTVLAAIKSLDGAFKNYMHATYAPAGRSSYYLPAIEVIAFQRDKLNPFLAQRDSLITDFVASAMVTIDGYAFTGKGPLGSMFNRDDYPSEAQIRQAFSVDIYLDPVSTDHWLVKHAQDAAAVMGKMYTQGMNKRLSDITEFIKRKLVESLDWAAKACEERVMGEDGKLQRKPIHESSVQAFMGLTDLLRKLNVNNDPKITAVAASFEALLAGTTVPALTESLKSDPLMREIVRDQVKAVRDMLDF
jgi:hypothetical protein